MERTIHLILPNYRSSLHYYTQNSGCIVLEFINNSNQLRFSWKLYSMWRIVIPCLCKFCKFLWACWVTQINWKQRAVWEKQRAVFRFSRRGEGCKIFQYFNWRSVSKNYKTQWAKYTHVCFNRIWAPRALNNTKREEWRKNKPFHPSKTSLYTMFFVLFPVGSMSLFGLAKILVVCLDTPLDSAT